MAKWSRNNRPAIGVRTLNEHEVEVVRQLEAQGYTVYKRGWPDYLAVKDDDVRFLEVKPSPISKLSQHQAKVAEILKRKYGIEVELARPPHYCK